MKKTYLFTIVVLTFALMSCSSAKQTKTETFWVSGLRTQCDAGAGKMMCLNVARTENIDNAVWENFYAPIDGFTFKERQVQKIKVTVNEVNKKRTPSDASNLQYALVAVLDTKDDKRAMLNGGWTLALLNGAPLNRMVSVPTMQIDLAGQRISGSGGCNNYSVGIKKVNSSAIELGAAAMTKKACINENVESQFGQALDSITSYKVDDSNVVFYDSSGAEVMAFVKNNTAMADTTVNAIWVATTIDGNPINRMVKAPQLEINSKEMKVVGNDGCNTFSGDIKKIDSQSITFGQLAKTEKACRNMDVAERFHRAMNTISGYKVEDGKLMLFNEENKEILKFLKTD